MILSKKSIIRAGIVIMILCGLLTAGCRAASTQESSVPDTDTESTAAVYRETTAVPETEAALPEPETMTVPESITQQPEPTTETSVSIQAETKEPELKPISGIDAVAGYVTSGEVYDAFWLDTESFGSDTAYIVAQSLYKDFLPCAVDVDGVWKKGLYNEEHNLLVVQDDVIVVREDGTKWVDRGVTYTVYHGGEELTVPADMPFPWDAFVRIELTDVNGDGEDELIITTLPKLDITYSRLIAFHLDPFVIMTDFYDKEGENSFVPQGRVISAEAVPGGEANGEAKIQVEFTMENGKKYLFEQVVEGADMTCLDQYGISFDSFSIQDTVPWNNKDSDEWILEAYCFDYMVAQPTAPGGPHKSKVWITVKIGLEYDDEAKRYIQGDDVTIE